nr:hypothetical protein [Bifidobacterium pseudolongum]
MRAIIAPPAAIAVAAATIRAMVEAPVDASSTDCRLSPAWVPLVVVDPGWAPAGSFPSRSAGESDPSSPVPGVSGAVSMRSN